MFYCLMNTICIGSRKGSRVLSWLHHCCSPTGTLQDLKTPKPCLTGIAALLKLCGGVSIDNVDCQIEL